MSEFTNDDFVQILHSKFENEVIVDYWRPALYQCRTEKGDHIVVYSDCTKQELRPDIKIRHAK